MSYSFVYVQRSACFQKQYLQIKRIFQIYFFSSILRWLKNKIMILFRSKLSKLTFCGLRHLNSSSTKQSTYHVLFYDYVPNILEKRIPYRQDHLKHAMSLVEKGHLQLGGAWAVDEDNKSNDSSNNQIDGACIVLKDMKKEEIENFVKNDPYFINGLVPNYRIRPWSVVIGAAMK